MMRSVILTLIASLALVNAIIPSPDQYKVNGLEKYGATDEMFAGLMPITWKDNNEGSLFFWLATHRPKEGKPRAPGPPKLVVWLNGGPGCSSMIGMMHEHGPFTIEPAAQGAKEGLKYNLKRNPYSWNEVANVLYVEQPIRTGFSVAAEGAGPIKDETQVAADFRNFLISFLDVFTEFKGAELYISGESYAGFYVPWIAEHIVKSQLVTNALGVKVRDTSLDGLNLQGVAIGNGVMDMYFQEPSYAEYAYYHGLIPLGAKQRFERDWAACMEMIMSRGEAITRGSFDECNMMGRVLEAAGLPNEYNTATFIQYAPIIGPGSTFDGFFQDPEIQEILHVRGYDLPGVNFLPETPPAAKPATSRRLQPAVATSTTITTTAAVTATADTNVATSTTDAATSTSASAQSTTADAGAGARLSVATAVADPAFAATEAAVGQLLFAPASASARQTAAPAADSSESKSKEKGKGKYYAPPHGWGACNDDIDESMSADHPTSVVPNLQFLSQVHPILVPSPLSGAAGAGTLSATGNLRATAHPADTTTTSSRSKTTSAASSSSTDTDTNDSIAAATEKARNWLYDWWESTQEAAQDAVEDVTSSLLPTTTTSPADTNPALEPGPVVPPAAIPYSPTDSAGTGAGSGDAPAVADTPASHAIRVLLYSGEFDLNCNTLGTLHTLEANRWRNKPWSMAERSLWKYGSDIAGEYMTMDEMFSFLIVRNSGHLLPKDLPAIALELIDRFINGRTFADQPLPSEHSYLVDSEAEASADALHMMQAPSPHLPTVASAQTNAAGAAGGAILAIVLLVAVLWRVVKFGSKEAASTAAGARTSTGVELSTHAYTAIPSAEVEFAAGSSRINMHETAASGTVTGYQAYK